MWHDGELFPASKDWKCAPELEPVCTHDHVVAPKTVDGQIANPGQGKMALYCFDCDSTWWEEMANVKGSPWEGK